MQRVLVCGAVALHVIAGFVRTDASDAHIGSTSWDLRPVTGERGHVGQLADIDVTGVVSYDALGSPNNTVLVVDVAALFGRPSGTQMLITGIGWDVTITTEGFSWLSEASIYFDDNINPDLSGLFLRPGVGNNQPGSMPFFSDPIDLSDNNVPNIVLPDGVLRMEFYETFDDVAGMADATWSGTITLGIPFPAPGAAAVFGIAAFAGSRRRRAR